jgi:hypothetical protein
MATLPWKKPQIPKTSMTTPHHHLPSFQKGSAKTFTICTHHKFIIFYLYIVNIPCQPTCKSSEYSERFPVLLHKKKLFFIAKNIPLKFSTFLKNNIISVQALKAIWKKQTTQVKCFGSNPKRPKPKASSSPYSFLEVGCCCCKCLVV